MCFFTSVRNGIDRTIIFGKIYLIRIRIRI